MEKYVLFDTSSGSQNMGDYIILDSVEKEMEFLFKNNFTIKLSTHSPVLHSYQCVNRNGKIKYCNEASNKFLAGTNMLNYNMMLPWCNWNVNIFNFKPYLNSTLVGVGMNPNAKKINFYTKFLYKKILSKDTIHSTRDEKTKLFIESLGFRAINTGCATLWSLTTEKCSKIPEGKSDNVIFTLTDYCKDIIRDQKLIDILIKNYDNVYYWVQGSNDLEYLKKFNNIENIKIVSPNLKSFSEVLSSKNIEYVGTRLHAGIYAMKHEVRSIILIVDNRARDMKDSYNLVCIERDDIDNLEKLINSSFKTRLNIDYKKINDFKNQFR